MDHELSVRMKAAEGYLLGELLPEEREAFEEHFFACPKCAEDVRTAYEFGDNVDAVFREGSSPVTTPGRNKRISDCFAWMRPQVIVPVAACLALAVFSGYQSAVVIPNLRAQVAESSRPQVVSSAVLVPSVRGALPSISIPAGAHFFHLSLDLGPAEHFERYAWDLRSGSGKSIWRIPLSTVNPETNVNLLIPASQFGAGSYEAVLVGIAGQETRELDHYRFDVRRQ